MFGHSSWTKHRGEAGQLEEMRQKDHRELFARIKACRERHLEVVGGEPFR